MNWRNTRERYGSLSIGMHWLMLVLLIAVYACIELTDLFAKGSAPREALKSWHFMLGLSVLVLVALRLLLRLAGPAPVVVPALPAWQLRISGLMHLALYALMIALPVLGWCILSAAGKPIPFFGLQLPAVLAENERLAHWLKEIHETLGTVGYFLIGAHALAALFHHYVMRDNALVRMLPRRS